MSRYTFKDLETDIMELNSKLMRVYNNERDMYPNQVDDLYFVAQQRYGYTAIDLATKDQSARGSVHNNLTIGSAWDCYTAAIQFIVNQL